MPQIEQVQTVHWGPLRPDPVDLAVDGVNVATGPNGSGKTTLLDAIKLALGVQDLARKPAQYVFDGGGEPSLRADRALIKVVFSNPERPARAGRVFSDAGRGCELTPYVTAVCEVSRDRRRYTILPGYVPWGGPGRSLNEDLRELAEIPSSHWMGPRQWGELLARAGVTRALLGVISVQQGETDKMIEGTPEALLRKILELTGKQSTLEEFRRARAKLAEVRAAYDETLRRFDVERRHLDALDVQAERHRELRELEARLDLVEGVLLPAARHARLRADRNRLAKEREGQLERLARDRAEIESLDAELPALAARYDELLSEAARLGDELRRARAALERAAREEGAARSRLDDARAAVEATGPVDVDAVEEAERAAVEAGRATHEASEEAGRIRGELAELRAGRPVRPPGLDAFRADLEHRGIATGLVAERVEVPGGVAAEAALGDGVWTVVVPPERFEEAVEAAVERGHRLPVAAAGEGAPTGALAGATGLEDALGYLEEADLPLEERRGDAAVAVSDRGIVRGRLWAAFRAPDRPVLGAAARDAAIARAEARLVELQTSLPVLRDAAAAAGERARTVRAGLEAATRIPGLEEDVRRAAASRGEVESSHEELTAALAVVGPEQGRVEQGLAAKRARREEIHRRITSEAEPRLVTYDRQLADVDAELEALALTDEQAAVDEPPSEEVLTHERGDLTARLADEVRFPPEVRTELVLAHRDDQARTVEEVERLVQGRRQDLDAVAAEVDRAREAYDRHIRQMVHLLAGQFREVCVQAGMEGTIDIVPSDVEGEFGVDVRVAHGPGEPKRSYQSAAHSGGQRAKISILLLLATMGLEGSADLLIMDEHIAHLDSVNIDYVAEVMRALKHRVQFILATPTNAEAGRLGWCDHQLAFYPRLAGEHYAPPVRLFTRMPENGERYAAMGQLSLEG